MDLASMAAWAAEEWKEIIVALGAVLVSIIWALKGERPAKQEEETNEAD